MNFLLQLLLRHHLILHHCEEKLLLLHLGNPVMELLEGYCLLTLHYKYQSCDQHLNHLLLHLYLVLDHLYYLLFLHLLKLLLKKLKLNLK